MKKKSVEDESLWATSGIQDSRYGEETYDELGGVGRVMTVVEEAGNGDRRAYDRQLEQVGGEAKEGEERNFQFKGSVLAARIYIVCLIKIFCIELKSYIS